MIPPIRSSPPGRSRAFSLVEVTLALGIVAFALVGILGVIPMALDNGRHSVDEGRAAAVASTLFAMYRGQSFHNVCYLDSQCDANGHPQPGGLDLGAALQATSSAPQPFYAQFVELATDAGVSGDVVGDQRRLCFTGTLTGGELSYLVTTHFSPPTGVPAVNGRPAQAVQIELIVASTVRPLQQYHFSSTVVDRAN